MTLVIDTTSSRGSIWLGSQADKAMYSAHWFRDRSHGERLTVELERIVRTFGLQQVSRILVGVGPGSFTGIRVGVNCAKTLAFARSIPVFGLRSTDLIAASSRLNQKGLFTVALPAQMGRLFVADSIARPEQFDTKGPSTVGPARVGPPRVELTTAFQQQVGCSVIGYQLDDLVSHWTEVYPMAEHGLGVPEDLWLGDGPWSKIQPLYIRGSGAEEHVR